MSFYGGRRLSRIFYAVNLVKSRRPLSKLRSSDRIDAGTSQTWHEAFREALKANGNQ